MSTDDRIQTLVLEEFHLRAADTDGQVARIVAAAPAGLEPAVPLLTSIDDGRDVAMLRALHADESVLTDAAQRAALDPFVSNWQAPREYVPRITERSQSPPTHYRLAVTESGINDAGPGVPPAAPRSTSLHGSSRRVGLLWIGRPRGSYAGLLTLLGTYEKSDPARPAAREWPLLLSRRLGVRIYETL